MKLSGPADSKTDPDYENCPIPSTSINVLFSALSGPADSKTDTGFEICPRFVGVIGQNKIQRTYDHNCIYH